MRTLVFTLNGLHCANCAQLIDLALHALGGVIAAETSVADERTVVHLDIQISSVEEVRRTITIFGFGGTLQPA